MFSLLVDLVLVFDLFVFVNLTQTGFIQEKETTTEKKPAQDQTIGESVGASLLLLLLLMIDVGGLIPLWVVPPLGCIRNPDGQVMQNKPKHLKNTVQSVAIGSLLSKPMWPFVTTWQQNHCETIIPDCRNWIHRLS